MFLIHIIGITSTGSTFTIGICFLPGEEEEDITWALQKFKKYGIDPGLVVTDADGATKNAVEAVFVDAPTILCIWHVNELVSARYIKTVGNEGQKEFMTSWRKVLAAPTVDGFKEQWHEFCTKYWKGQTQDVVDYIEKQWIHHGKKERLCAAWTSQYWHYGTLVSSWYVVFNLIFTLYMVLGTNCD